MQTLLHLLFTYFAQMKHRVLSEETSEKVQTINLDVYRKKIQWNFKPLAVLSTVQPSIHEVFHPLNTDVAYEVIKRKTFLFPLP